MGVVLFDGLARSQTAFAADSVGLGLNTVPFTADHRGRSSGDGWVGRLIEAAYGDDVYSNRVVHVGYDRGVGHSSKDDYALYIDPDTDRLALINHSVTETGIERHGRRCCRHLVVLCRCGRKHAPGTQPIRR